MLSKEMFYIDEEQLRDVVVVKNNNLITGIWVGNDLVNAKKRIQSIKDGAKKTNIIKSFFSKGGKL